MKTASLGRKLGDWLGVVPEDETVPVADAVPEGKAHPSPSPSVFDIETVPRGPVVREPVAVVPEIVGAPVERVPLGSPTPEPAAGVRTFREVVNQRRADSQRRAGPAQATTRW